MKIAFYLENRDIPEVDLSHPELGNPGCGGTEYLFVALPYYLDKLQGEECKVILLANNIENLPDALDNLEVKDACDAILYAKKEECDFFVYRARRHPEKELLSLVKTLKVPTIVWAHIIPNGEHLRQLATNESIKSIVCVEHEQYDLAQDSVIWKKLTYIVNGFDLKGYQLEKPPVKNPNEVVYIGALVKQKGFHLLAKAWPKVLRRHPDAHLSVIGTGALYDSKAKLGPWGVAEEGYEKEFIHPYLQDSNGLPHPSVNFLGRLGSEKKEILYRATVGVPNPVGDTENCPGSAIEIQASGTAVVSGAYYGLLDTVRDGETGLLGRTEDDLVNNICRLLKDRELAEKFGDNGIRFIEERYNFRKVTLSWLNLFYTLKNGQQPERIKFKKNLHRHAKYIIVINRYFQIIFGNFIKWPSLIEMKINILKLLKNIKVRGGQKKL
jgi:glycosyltransferase involved in cell wall biosynthesis